MALPIGVEPTIVVRGAPVALGIRVGGLAITPHAIWLGAHVSVAVGDEAVARRTLAPSGLLARPVVKRVPTKRGQRPE